MKLHKMAPHSTDTHIALQTEYLQEKYLGQRTYKSPDEYSTQDLDGLSAGHAVPLTSQSLQSRS